MHFPKPVFTFPIRAFVAVAALMTPAAGLAGDRELTVAELVAEVIRANPELAIYEAELEAARGERRQAARWANPEFSLEAGRMRVRRGSAAAEEGTTWAASVAQPIEFPGRLALRKAIANADIELAELGVQHFRTLLAHRVEALAHRLHATRGLAEATEAVAERARELTEAVLQREAGGITPLLERRALESSRLILQRRRMEAWHEHQQALIELNQIRDLPAETPVRIEEPELPAPQLPTMDALVRRAWQESFEARARMIELEQQGFRVELARNERYPTVTIEPFVSRDAADERETVVGIGISMALPLWDRNSGNIAASRARQRQAEAALLVMRREVEGKVVGHALAYEAAVEALHALNPDAVERLEEAADLAESHYRKGAIPVEMYLETQSAWLDALEAFLDMRQEALESRLQLELLSGKLDTEEETK